MSSNDKSSYFKCKPAIQSQVKLTMAQKIFIAFHIHVFIFKDRVFFDILILYTNAKKSQRENRLEKYQLRINSTSTVS